MHSRRGIACTLGVLYLPRLHVSHHDPRQTPPLPVLAVAVLHCHLVQCVCVCVCVCAYMYEVYTHTHTHGNMQGCTHTHNRVAYSALRVQTRRIVAPLALSSANACQDVQAISYQASRRMAHAFTAIGQLALCLTYLSANSLLTGQSTTSNLTTCPPRSPTSSAPIPQPSAIRRL